MSAAGSVTQWIARLQAGDEEAARLLWDRYFQPLVGLARKKLQGTSFRSAEEDVALSAFHSFWQNAQKGKFPHLAGRANLWGLLITLTSRKACDFIAHEMRRYPGPIDHNVEQILGREPDPALAALVAEEFERLLDRLNDPVLQAIAVWKMEGHTNKEIAAKLSQVKQTGERTVERKLERIRAIWEREARHE
jgi:DNA-directed RNA polymerase specialized sigma24 family protein